MKSFTPPIKKDKILLSNPFDFFEDIFCINLDSRKDRCELVNEEFKKIGIENKVKRFSKTKVVVEYHNLIKTFERFNFKK